MKKDNRMRREKWMQALFVMGIGILISGCSSTKNIPLNDALFTGSKIKIVETQLPSKDKKNVLSELKTLTVPRPNSKILGLPFKLWMYNLGSERGIGKWIRKKFGEEPVLLSQVNENLNSQILDNYLKNRGFFQAQVDNEIVEKGNKASIKYDIHTGAEYRIGSISFPSDSGELADAIRTIGTSTLITPGTPFNLNAIVAERARINSVLKDRGYYYFNDDYLLMESDTTIGRNEVAMYLKIKKITPEEAKHPYRIKSVIIYPNYELSNNRQEVDSTSVLMKEGFLIIDSTQVFKPIVFETAMQFRPGDLYSIKNHNATLSRLISLGAFKFVKNRFEPVVDSNNLRLNTFYYLTPMPKKSLRFELLGTSKTNNLIGSQVNIGWRNRNAFRGAEQFNINLFAGAELQINGNFANTNTYRIGGETSISIPRFVIPFIKVRGPGESVPRTNMLIGYEQLNRSTLYTLNSFKAQYGYSWKENKRKEHQLNPISISYVNPIDITQLYRDSIISNPSLARITDRQFIIGSTYNFNYNQLQAGNNQTGLYFNGLLDIAGNILGLATGANWKTNDTISFFGSPFSQFVKAEADLRYYKQLTKKTNWASRMILGLGLPYGNSKQIPFVKQFFAGGNNSLRGFRSRSVGPGIYRTSNAGNTQALFLPDQSGDIKFEVNTEFRLKLFSILEGAIFADAGNIWLLNEDPLKPGAKISSRFLKELAMDAGFGLRFDFTILLLRFDFAFPLKVPYADVPPDSGTVINLAIGYPF
jgi:outer membrane protein assembly factor BamA